MIATDQLIYLHLHKSGGTFINECLMKYFPGAHQLGYHLPARLIPKLLRGLPVLGFVRNPWSYYVSWYSFQARMAQGNVVFRTVSEDGRLGFKDTVSNLLDLGSGGAKLEPLLEALPGSYTNKGINLPRPALEPIRNSGRGFYSYLYQYMFTGYSGSLFIGYTESIRKDFLDFMAKHHIEFPEDARK